MDFPQATSRRTDNPLEEVEATEVRLMPTCLAISAGLTPALRSSRTLSALALAVGARLTETVCNREQTGIHRLIFW